MSETTDLTASGPKERGERLPWKRPKLQWLSANEARMGTIGGSDEGKDSMS